MEEDPAKRPTLEQVMTMDVIESTFREIADTRSTRCLPLRFDFIENFTEGEEQTMLRQWLDHDVRCKEVLLNQEIWAGPLLQDII